MPHFLLFWYILVYTVHCADNSHHIRAMRQYTLIVQCTNSFCHIIRSTVTRHHGFHYDVRISYTFSHRLHKYPVHFFLMAYWNWLKLCACVCITLIGRINFGFSLWQIQSQTSPLRECNMYCIWFSIHIQRNFPNAQFTSHSYSLWQYDNVLIQCAVVLYTYLSRPPIRLWRRCILWCAQTWNAYVSHH